MPYKSDEVLIRVSETIEVRPEFLEIPQWGRYLKWSVYATRFFSQDTEATVLCLIRIIPMIATATQTEFRLKAQLRINGGPTTEATFTNQQDIFPYKLSTPGEAHPESLVFHLRVLSLQEDASSLLPAPQPDFSVRPSLDHDTDDVVTLKTKQETVYHAARQVLIGSSRHFAQLLTADDVNSIDLPEDDAVDIVHFLACIHPNSTVLICERNVQPLARLSAILDCRQLRQECTHAVFRCVTPRNVLHMHSIASAYLYSTELLVLCLRMIVRLEWASVLASAQYRELSNAHRLRITEYMLCHANGLPLETTIVEDTPPSQLHKHAAPTATEETDLPVQTTVVEDTPFSQLIHEQDTTTAAEETDSVDVIEDTPRDQ